MRFNVMCWVNLRDLKLRECEHTALTREYTYFQVGSPLFSTVNLGSCAEKVCESLLNCNFIASMIIFAERVQYILLPEQEPPRLITSLGYPITASHRVFPNNIPFHRPTGCVASYLLPHHLN